MASPTDIDRDFLSRCLGERYEILEFDVTLGSKPGDNFLSVIYSASVKLTDVVTQETNLRHFVIKCYPSHPGRQEYNNQTNIFYKELQIYKTWLPQLLNFQTEVLGMKEEDKIRLPYPPFITGKATNYSELPQQVKSEKDGVVASNPLDNFLMMEDLRKTWGFKMTDRRSSFDLNHIKLVIQALGKLHAMSWGYKHHVTSNIQKRFPFLMTPFKREDMETWIQILNGSFRSMAEVLDGNATLVEALEGYQPKVTRILDAFLLDGVNQQKILEEAMRVKQDEKVLESIKDPWEVVLHGDCWSNNMLFRYDEATGRPVEVILVDLQMVFEGCPTFDLSYVLYASCRSELRKAHLPSLLRLYVDTFNDSCAKLRCPTLPNFSLETLSARFHRILPQAFITASMLIPIMLKEEGKAVNLEEMDHSKDITELMETAMTQDGTTGAYKERVVELVHEMYDLGIL